jgi:acyl dehydratase
MPFDSATLMQYRVRQAEQHLSPKDCILYALSVGAGMDPEDRRQLPFFYEERLRALPMMANVLAHPGFWVREPATGIEWRKVVHGEQSFTLHRRLPTYGTLIGSTQITAIMDKGVEKGAFVYSRREVTEKASGDLVCTLTQTNVCRGDGGCGSIGAPPESSPPMPKAEPDRIFDITIAPNAALLYRLNGDSNPLHVDPEVARAAGFDRPILHGLCTFGHAGLAILRECCDYDESRLRHMRVRFTAPVFPGETLRTEVWSGAMLRFRTRVVDRSVVVLDHGLVELGDFDRPKCA